jgi:hypothetical protein
MYLHARRKEPKSIFHTSLLPNPERLESSFVAFGDAFVRLWGQELLAAASVKSAVALCGILANRPDHIRLRKSYVLHVSQQITAICNNLPKK